MQVPTPLTPAETLSPGSSQGSRLGAPGKTSPFAATSPVHPRFPTEGDSHTTPRKHQYFMGSSLLASNFVFNCHETIQNFQLRANRLLSGSRRPEQAGVIILKASDGAAHCCGSPICLSVVAAGPLQAEHPASLCSKQASGRQRRHRPQNLRGRERQPRLIEG